MERSSRCEPPSPATFAPSLLATLAALTRTVRLAMLAMLAMLASGACASAAVAQSEMSRASTARAPARAPSAFTSVATRATRPPLIDGRDVDDVWARAQTIDAFRVFDPVEDGEPSMRTMAKITYDERNLYILVRAFDPHPDSIVSLLSRRDVKTPSDQIKVVVDSYFDRRTGYQFAVNPAGVQRDYYLFNDAEEDESWDAVWEASTTIDSLGWVAEFRIPLSQLRYPRRESHTFGVGVHRDIARSSERVSWPVFRRSRFGFSSQLGEVSGISGIESPRRLELRPYAVAMSSSEPRGDAYGRKQEISVGADVKYGVTSNLTVDATINPDFGQVEADPAVLNLSAFETFFPERRPFFLEGTGIFRFDMSCSDGTCTGLFYSRRIGRAPQVTGDVPDADENRIPGATTILAAAKLTGRLGNGLSIGVLDAVTQSERVGDIVVEPQTNYFVARLQQDFRTGASGLGMMVTAVNRNVDAMTGALLRREAYASGVDFRHRFSKGRFQLAGYVIGTLVKGSPDAIAHTQRSSNRYYQRPDDDIAYDPTRTNLGGGAFQLGLNKSGGGILRFWTGYTGMTPGFEINDLGFISGVGSHSYSNWFALVFQRPRAFYRRMQINLNQWQNYAVGNGLPTSRGGNINANAQLRNMWFVWGGIGTNRTGYCASCMRGGPALLQSPALNTWLGVEGDSRRMLFPAFNVNYTRSDEGRSSYLSFNPRLEMRLASRFSTSVGVSLARNIDDNQWYENYGVSGHDTTHYTLARLDQKTISLTARLNFTVTPTLSLQFYGQPFVSSGSYSDWRELGQPRAADYDARYRPYRGDPGGFNVKQLRSNTVVRWEYRPGSTLFVVWQQGRYQDGIDEGTFEMRRDFQRLFGAHPNNTFLIKASYWLGM